MDKKAIRKWVLYLVLGMLIMILQEHLFARMQIYGVHPMLGGVLTAVISMFEGGIGGAAFGLYIGIIQDASVVGAEGYYALLYLAAGMTTGFVCEYMFRKNFLTALLWSLAITSVATLFYFLLFFFITGRAGISALWMKALPEIIYSALFLPLIYFSARYIACNDLRDD